MKLTISAYSQRLSEAGITGSVGRKGDSYENALAESVNALYKKEVVGQRYSWYSVTKVVRATSDWAERLHSWCGYAPPAEFEHAFWHDRPQQPPAAA